MIPPLPVFSLALLPAVFPFLAGHGLRQQLVGAHAQQPGQGQDQGGLRPVGGVFPFAHRLGGYAQPRGQGFLGQTRLLPQRPQMGGKDFQFHGLASLLCGIASFLSADILSTGESAVNYRI